jgi:phosphate acetyltransferase
MSFTENMRKKARELQHSLVLAEGTENRTIHAARIITDKKLASVVFLVGLEESVREAASDAGVSLHDIEIQDPYSSERREEYAEEFFQLRKHKGIEMEDARKKMEDNLNWGAMMVRLGHADAMVAGAENSTGKVLVSGFTIIKTAPGVRSASSCFVMDMPDKKWGKDGLMIFSDCATVPDPTVDQLAEITTQSAQSCRTFLQTEPLVAMLSFSTKGSARHPMVDKVTQAMAKVFPDLQSGNIGYKLVQRFAGAGAYGPFLQGFSKPISDLSRGCSVEDIINTCAVTLTQV